MISQTCVAATRAVSRATDASASFSSASSSASNASSFASSNTRSRNSSDRVSDDITTRVPPTTSGFTARGAEPEVDAEADERCDRAASTTTSRNASSSRFPATSTLASREAGVPFARFPSAHATSTSWRGRMRRRWPSAWRSAIFTCASFWFFLSTEMTALWLTSEQPETSSVRSLPRALSDAAMSESSRTCSRSMDHPSGVVSRLGESSEVSWGSTRCSTKSSWRRIRRQRRQTCSHRSRSGAAAVVKISARTSSGRLSMSARAGEGIVARGDARSPRSRDCTFRTDF